MANRRAILARCSVMLSLALLACGARSQLDATDLGSVAGVSPVDESRVPLGGAPACASLPSPSTAAPAEDLQIQLGCGFRSASSISHSGFRPGGTECEVPGGVNSFALQVEGPAAPSYSAVVRCGYIRYDNGTFVGERLQVEARDGKWCDDVAAPQLNLVDRMLLTDVSFAVEPRVPSAAQRQLAVSFATLEGWTRAVPPETPLCVYVAHRAPGIAECRLAPPASYCSCPCGDGWDDFFIAVKLALVQP